MMKLRAPAYPLITVDPFFSVWSMSDRLTESDVKTWFGRTCYLLGIAEIDGVKYTFMGDAKGLNYPAMTQVCVDVDAFSTVYTFKAGGVVLKARFTTPVLPDDIDVFTKPISYLSIGCASDNGGAHSVKISVSASEQFCVQPKLQNCILTEGFSLENGISVMKMGGSEQNILGYSGDDTGIDWGYFYLAVEGGKTEEHHIGKMTFVKASKEFCISAEKNGRSLFVFAYDDIYSVKYFGKMLKAYWNRGGKDISELIAEAFTVYEPILKRCEEFDERLCSDAKRIGGYKYAELLQLSLRQIMAAHKAVIDEDGELLYISKECLSNGCASTVDITYPSIPFYLLYNPRLIYGMMRPVIRFANSGLWKYNFAPHDVGTYPILSGQVYACNCLENQMPVEESGNMLLILAAASIADNSFEFLIKNRDLFDKWAAYLTENGFDPENQLCTDDFAGKLAHNCNLSLKTAVALNAYGRLCSLAGIRAEGERLVSVSKQMSVEWKRMAQMPNGGYALTFDCKDTFSMKYNAVWDKVFGLDLFAPEDFADECKLYKERLNPYGLPLDSRSDCTKSDWMIWISELTEDPQLENEIIARLWNAYNLSPSRVPMTDLFSSVTSLQIHFQHRSVQGGLFIKLLSRSGICRMKK